MKEIEFYHNVQKEKIEKCFFLSTMEVFFILEQKNLIIAVWQLIDKNLSAWDFRKEFLKILTKIWI